MEANRPELQPLETTPDRERVEDWGPLLNVVDLAARVEAEPPGMKRFVIMLVAAERAGYSSLHAEEIEALYAAVSAATETGLGGYPAYNAIVNARRPASGLIISSEKGYTATPKARAAAEAALEGFEPLDNCQQRIETTTISSI